MDKRNLKVLTGSEKSLREPRTSVELQRLNEIIGLRDYYRNRIHTFLIESEKVKLKIFDRSTISKYIYRMITKNDLIT